MNYQTEGVVLKSFSSGEYDRIYWFFSPQFGKINFVAKGVRKSLAKLAGGLEPLTQAEVFLVKGKKIDRVVGVTALDQFQEIQKNLEKNIRARSILELLFYLEMDSSEAEKIYFQLKQYLFELNKSMISLGKTDLLSLGAIWKIIFLSGWGIDFFHCLSCGEKLQREKKNYFCFGRGVICVDCLKKETENFFHLPIEKDVIKLLRFLVQQDLIFCKKLNLSDRLILTLKKLTKAYLDEIIGKKMLDLWF